LRAAETAASAGLSVTLFESMPSVGRKFLVAGRGGLNLTHAEDPRAFAARYSGNEQPALFWESVLQDFGPETIREWAAELGIETFAASTGRVYPAGMKAAPLLRRWVERLRRLGVHIAVRHRLTRLVPGAPFQLEFDSFHEPVSASAVILACGGASWPGTGSTGLWTSVLSPLGIQCRTWAPANCGWETPWPSSVLQQAEGRPLKNIAVSVGNKRVRGELLLTQYGLEGGALYALGAELRYLNESGTTPILRIDLKPDVPLESLLAKLGPVKRNLLHEAATRWRLCPVGTALLNQFAPALGENHTPESVAQAAKSLPIGLIRPRPIAEAISSAGGLAWNELDSTLMLRRVPGLFAAGEMIDWEAPTGGYLLQGCFATGTRAGKSAAQWILDHRTDTPHAEIA
jgi:uncharacterized flavoprotein (TIGR03862 family)